MLQFGILLICIFTATFLFLRKRSRKPDNLPPGPRQLPLVGSLFSIDIKDLQGTYYKLAKQYGPIFRVHIGPIFRVHIGPFPSIILNDPKLIKEAFTQDVLQARSQYLYVSERNRQAGSSGKNLQLLCVSTFRNASACFRCATLFSVLQFFYVVVSSILSFRFSGVIFAEGEVWKEHRRFVMQCFRDFGVGKNIMEEKIIEEVEHLIETLRKTNSSPIDTKLPLSTAVGNVVSSVMNGKRYEVDDPEFQNFVALTTEAFEITLAKTLTAVLPFLRFFPPFSYAHRRWLEVFKGQADFFRRATEEHLKNWTEGKTDDLI